MRRRLVLRHLFVIAIVGVFPAIAQPAEPAVKVQSTREPLGLSPLVHSPDFFSILPWGALHGWKKTGP